MEIAIVAPRKLYEKARERGIDVELFITDPLAREPGLDPGEEANVHIELAEKIGEDILYAWDAAYYLHVEGFHEARLVHVA